MCKNVGTNLIQRKGGNWFALSESLIRLVAAFDVCERHTKIAFCNFMGVCLCVCGKHKKHRVPLDRNADAADREAQR